MPGYYLPFRNPYKNRHFIHETLFTGYNQEEDTLYGMSFLKETGQYGSFTVAMAEVENAYSSTFFSDYDLTCPIQLIRPKPFHFFNSI